VRRFITIVFAVLTDISAVAQRVEPAIELSVVRVEVIWVRASELAKLRQRYQSGPPPFRKDNFTSTEKGLAVLGKRNGEDVCLIFVERPVIVDSDKTRTLGHEFLHCLFGAYH
jgi:hypothetical protein